MNIEIHPLSHVVIGETSIYLGMAQEKAKKLIGAEKLVDGTAYYYENELALEYDCNNQGKFIECLAGKMGS
ncbi:hypothetical protein [Enterococcus sp. AZ194]|uniref:hypothetical protein n=1 Tax=Enterococcus sp. AZ194 TaxID=2774629 RepID=UPI003F6861E6